MLTRLSSSSLGARASKLRKDNKEAKIAPTKKDIDLSVDLAVGSVD